MTREHEVRDVNSIRMSVQMPSDPLVRKSGYVRESFRHEEGLHHVPAQRLQTSFPRASIFLCRTVQNLAPLRKLYDHGLSLPANVLGFVNA
jgi:hypothetical protein